MAGGAALLEDGQRMSLEVSGRSVKQRPGGRMHGCCVCLGIWVSFDLITKIIFLLWWHLWTPAPRAWPYACEDAGMACRTMEFSGFEYQCRFAGEDQTKGDVLLLHGFPFWSDMWNLQMLALAEKGYRSVACNQRGYSPGARPDDVAQYSYNVLRNDVFAMADAAGFDKFHLIGHDHGAVLGWHTVQSDRGRALILSYNAQSIPHPVAFSEMLYGENADVNQQVASQYFTVFVFEDSASRIGAFLYRAAGRFVGFESAEAFQKSLFWYHGAFEVGVIAMPPVMSISEIRGNGGNVLSEFIRWWYPAEPDEGKPAKVGASDIPMPVLYICGTNDPAILCSTDTALKTKDYVSGKYTYLGVECGHELIGACDKTQEVIDAGIKHIEDSTP